MLTNEQEWDCDLSAEGTVRLMRPRQWLHRLMADDFRLPESVQMKWKLWLPPSTYSICFHCIIGIKFTSGQSHSHSEVSQFKPITPEIRTSLGMRI